ncbi:MAG: hypothetical protein J7463_08640 [Roseiflexus sp.]|jgi:hypothetical protein|nr:hypothetical protein [Roseiflexus sp.]MBO9335514.1 hypothetical protein [Roseiflexus sp.]MBO9366492.1 hypothetical protein [Roseiflexus sp.]MBO9383633.1 hypothetical protein [Roseiflexus sp.]MBO9388488.1 hypothetical protein [Roseiflexus sp.]
MIETHSPSYDTIQTALTQLTGLADRADLPALVERAPIILSDDFFAAAQAAAADPAAAILRERLQWLTELRQQAERDVPAAVQAVLAATTIEELRQVADQWPLTLTDAFVEAIEHLAQQFADAGQLEIADRLRQRLVGLAQLRIYRETWTETPQGKAIFAFLNAEDDAAALSVFHTHRDLLDHPEAQRTLDDVLRGGNPESQQRLERRRALLRYLRGEEQPQ